MLRSVSSSLTRVGLSSFTRMSHRNFSALLTLQSSPASSNYSLLLSQTMSRAVHLSCIRSANQTNTDDIDRSLLRLDTEIRRTGRITRHEIDEILQDIRDMKKATSSQSLMIIRCCGDLVPSETPENRTKLVQEVWKTMENLNVPMDVSHYNALLRVYLENEYKFNPSEFLQELSSKGIEPNRVTYQRLIARFCQEGDIDGASTILQHMKEKQLPINEHVFNALIGGHARADDMESAEGIIGVMSQAGLEPNDDTYVTLICGYARKGDIENIKRIVQDCEAKQVLLIDRDFLEVIFTLASNNHENLVEEIIPHLKKHTGFNQDCTNLILRLVSIGKEEVGFRILKEMSPLTRNDEVQPSGNFFINQMVTSTTPSEKIIKFCKTMMDEGSNKYALSRACEYSLYKRKFEKATDLLEALKETGLPLRQHYFWPFFANSQVEKDVYDGLKCMQFLEISPSNETLREYIVPALLRLSPKTAPAATLEKLSSYTGIPLSTIVPAAMQHLLNDKDMDTAVQFATKYRLRFGNPQLRRAIVDSYFKHRNASMFVRIIGSAGLDGEDKAREAVGLVLTELVESIRSRDKAAILLPVLKELLKHGLGLTNSGSELIQNSLGEELTPEITNTILQLTSGELSQKLDLYPQQKKDDYTRFDEKSDEELVKMLKEAEVAGKPSKGIKKALLFSYCRKKKLEEAEAIKQDLQADGFVFPTGLQALLLDLYSQCDKLEEAKAMYSSLINNLETPVDDVKILRYATLLLSNDQFTECIDVLKSTPRDESRKSGGAVQQATVWKLLNILAEAGQVEKLLELFETLKDRNLIHVNNVVLGPLIKAYLIRDDLDGALKYFEKCVQDHHCTPWKQELFCRFIKTEDTDRLQKVMDLSTNLHGEVNSMYDLVFAFIQCGKVRQAKKILETPGLRARNDKIEMTCQKYLDEDRTSELEHLIQVTKDLVDIDRNSMYFYLLQSYCKAGDSDKALSVWTSLQEENVQASPTLLSFLADFLQKNNRPIPFVVPEKEKLSNESSSSPVSTVSPALSEFRQCIDSNEIDKALQIKQRLDGNEGKGRLNLTDLTSLVEKMTRAERLGEATRLTEDMLENGTHPHPKTLRFLLGRLASAGDVDVLNRFGDKLSPELKRLTMYNGRQSIAYTNAGRGKEYFETFIKGPVENMISTNSSESKVFIPLTGSTYILTRNEDLLGDFEELSIKAEQKGINSLNNTLFNYHMLKRNFDKAKEIWEAKLQNETRVIFRSVIVESQIKKDDQMAKELANLVMASDSVSNATKGLACSCVLDILATSERAEDALTYLQDSLKLISLENFNTGSLRQIKDKLEAKGKNFPYKIPKKDTRRKKIAATSDSSGSDSD